ncbi:MAG: C39 family peptidase [Oscillospiraceae bacterium]|nr:C39 family peptidase [Oscillospiraceae bacterium]
MLAVLCIGGVELAACRTYAPEVYEAVTTPVYNGVTAAISFGRSVTAAAWRAVVQTGQQLWDATVQCGRALWGATVQLGRSLQTLLEPKDKDLARQFAGTPALETEALIFDTSITTLKESPKGQVLTGGSHEVVYFNQGEAPWADMLYGTDPISSYGCGPTAMAMVVSTLTDQASDPGQMAQWAAEHGYWAKGSGSYLSIIRGTAAAYGLTAESCPARTPEGLRQTLSAGNLMIALVGPGHFTQYGHFILLRGVNEDGTLLVADPNSKERSLSVWDPQLILDELSKNTSDGAPLWVLSADQPPDTP